MKKLILSSLAVLGLSAAFVAPAEAQVLVNSTAPGASITGAASFTNFNGSTSAVAGEVTYPSRVYATDVVVTIGDGTGTGILGAAIDGNVVLTILNVGVTTALQVATPDTTVEGAVSADLVALDPATSPGLNQYVSIVRAWQSGGLD
jgi:hypothetical protein